jgi:hypothetical protein
MAAELIIGYKTDDQTILQHAREIAVAQLKLNRIREARHHLLKTKMAGERRDPPERMTVSQAICELSAQLLNLERYERRARGRRERAIRAFDAERKLRKPQV